MDVEELAKELRKACGVDSHARDFPRHFDWLAVARRAKAYHAKRDAEIRRLCEQSLEPSALCPPRSGETRLARRILALTPKEPT